MDKINMKRLPPIFEERQRGWETDLKTGERKPKMVTYIIGHGQQLARKRLAEKARGLAAQP